MSNITPGEWETNDGIVTNEEGEFVCDCAPAFEGVTKSAKANARAISAVPDLLKALAACYLRLASRDAQGSPECELAKAAFAKARFTLDESIDYTA